MTRWRDSLSGVADTLRQGGVAPKALAVLDSRSLVRSLFLSSALRFELLQHLVTERSADELAELTGATNRDRLRAWLQVGVELGELRRRDNSYRVSGRRARALAGGDEFLAAHYRSILEYQVGPYAELDELLGNGAGGGRDDLDRYADDIARVSLAAAPFVSSMVRRTIAELHPVRVLDAGCGSGIYTRVVLEADPVVHVVGVDLAESVIADAREELARTGHEDRAQLYAGDMLEWLVGSEDRFDLVMLINNIYYFEGAQRREIYRLVSNRLTETGQLLVVSMTTPGSIAAAHLDLMLRCQSGTASLPDVLDLRSDLLGAGYELVEELRLVPTEPFVGFRARPRG
jgi:SAM-dependent methyltransferase